MMPAIYVLREDPAAGGLMSYGTQYLLDADEYNYLLTHWHYTDDMQLMTGSGGAWYRWYEYLFTTNMVYGSGQRSGFANQEHTPPYVTVNAGITRGRQMVPRI
jgi:hypothetical protein